MPSRAQIARDVQPANSCLTVCHSSIGGQIVFWVGPWTTAVRTLLIVQLGGSRFWKGRADVLAWRAAHGGYLGTVCRGTAWMFAGLFLSYAAELAVVFLLPPSPTAMHLFPFVTYSPLLLAFGRCARG